ncbi:MAG: DUF5947 family protein [Streptosporangiaceae bacterium]
MTAGSPGAPGVRGLRRFVKPPAGASAPGARPSAPPGQESPPPGQAAHLAPGAHPDPRADAAAEAERCQMCNEVLNNRHGHLVDTDKRSLACACRACYLLFTHEGAAGSRFRAVPERVCHDPDRPLTDADWNELQIPVAMAFFFFNSALGKVVAGYPSPAGPTECELDLAAWDRLAAAHPLLDELAPDVEAIFVNRTDDGSASPGGRPPQTPPGKAYEVFLIPIDECYSLVGELRLLWQGFDGGAEVRAALASFLAGLRQRAIVLEREH